MVAALVFLVLSGLLASLAPAISRATGATSEVFRQPNRGQAPAVPTTVGRPEAVGRLAVAGGADRSQGTLRFNLSSDPTTLNPLFAHADAAVVEQQLAHLVFEPFFDLDPRGRPVPELITAIPTIENGGISHDGRSLTYHLRKGVLWSDGVSVTARDVLFTLRAILDPKNPVGSREGYDLIDRAEALDSYTVRFHLKRAWAPAVATFFTYGTSPQYVLPEHILAKQAPLNRAAFNQAPTVGDGPYSFVAWKHGDRLTYAANARYWRGTPRISKLDIRLVPDPQTNLTMLQTGELDFNLIAPVQKLALSKVANIGYASASTALIAGIAFNVSHAPLDDAHVRAAIAQSIDRAAISQKLTFGLYPVSNSDRPRFSWAYDPAVRQPAYDAAAADAALDAAGWRRGSDGTRARGGRRLALTYVQFPESTTGVRVATFVQAALRQRGIELTVKSIGMAQLFLPANDGGVLAGGSFDLAYVPWQMGADPEDRFLLGCSNAIKNYMRYCDREVERLEAQAAVEPSQAKRRNAYRQIDRIIARDVPILYLFNPNYVYAYRARLHGFAPNAFIPTWNAYAWTLE